MTSSIPVKQSEGLFWFNFHFLVKFITPKAAQPVTPVCKVSCCFKHQVSLQPLLGKTTSLRQEPE